MVLQDPGEKLGAEMLWIHFLRCGSTSFKNGSDFVIFLGPVKYRNCSAGCAFAGTPPGNTSVHISVGLFSEWPGNREIGVLQ